MNARDESESVHFAYAHYESFLLGAARITLSCNLVIILCIGWVVYMTVTFPEYLHIYCMHALIYNSVISYLRRI